MFVIYAKFAFSGVAFVSLTMILIVAFMRIKGSVHKKLNYTFEISQHIAYKIKKFNITIKYFIIFLEINLI